MRDRDTSTGHPFSRRLSGLRPERFQFFLQTSESIMLNGSFRCAHIFGLLSIEGSRPFRAITIDGNGLETQSPAFDIGIHDLLDARGFRKIHRLRNRTTEEWLAGGHHAQMAHVMETALSLKRLESAIKHRQMLWFQPTLACNARLRNRDTLNRVAFVYVGPELLDFF